MAQQTFSAKDPVEAGETIAADLTAGNGCDKMSDR
jgi:hypothetical protein